MSAGLGYDWVLILLVAWIWFTLAAVLAIRVPEPALDPNARLAFAHTLANALRGPRTWMGIAFAATSAAAFEATGQLAGPFLVDRGVAATTIGVFFGVAVVAAMLTGGLVGGALSDRWGHPRSVALFLCGFVSTVLLLAIVDATTPGRTGLLLASLFAMYFFVGLFIAASYAMFMDLTDPRLGGTQFSAYMAATNACESWSVWAGGRIAGVAGYSSAFAVMAVASLLSLPILRLLTSTRPWSTRRT